MAPFFLFDDFHSYLLAEKRFSSHTIVAYLKDVEQFFDYSPIESTSELKEINHKRIP